jgi:hypothetical protein
MHLQHLFKTLSLSWVGRLFGSRQSNNWAIPPISPQILKLYNPLPTPPLPPAVALFLLHGGNAEGHDNRLVGLRCPALHFQNSLPRDIVAQATMCCGAGGGGLSKPCAMSNGAFVVSPGLTAKVRFLVVHDSLRWDKLLDSLCIQILVTIDFFYNDFDHYAYWKNYESNNYFVC